MLSAPIGSVLSGPELLGYHAMPAFQRRDAAELFCLTDKLELGSQAWIDPATELALTGAIERCRGCAHKELCREILAKEPHSLGSFVSFCPNINTLAGLRRL
jgi:hypothetical protein